MKLQLPIPSSARLSSRALSLYYVPPGGSAWRCVFSVAAFGLFAAGASGQAVPPRATTASEPEETITLSPFVVTDTANVGYEATESLAGTGLNTKLTDLGASVSVITSKFLEDTASTNLRETLVYQTSMETTGYGGNLSGANSAPGGVVGEPDLTGGLPGTRVRGLAQATHARNFFRNSIPMDSYNTDRVEINRGANALLFGVGSPAGIINTSTIAANLNRRAGSFDLSGGSHGSWRSALKYNHVLLKDELAVVVAAVRGRDKYQQKFAFSDSDRQYVAAGWNIKPLRNRGLLSSTTVRASFENGEIESNRPRVLTPSDRLSSWFDATLPEDLKALGAHGKVSYDPRTGPFNGFNRTLGNATVGVIDNVNRSPTFFFQDVNSRAPRDNVPANAAGQTVVGRPMVSNNVYYPSTGRTGIAVGAYSREMNRVRGDFGLPDQTFYTAENLTDPTIFDYFNNTLVGPNSNGLAKFRVVDATLEQLFLDRKAGLELSFSSQEWNEGLQSLLPQASPYISIDVNTHMWTGEVNPNYGRPFISTAGKASYRELSVDTARAKLFYELNFQEKSRGRIGWLLGKHIFSILLQEEKLGEEGRFGGSVHYTPDFWANSNQARTAGQGKQIVTWVYLGPSLANAASPRGANLPGLQQNLLNFHQELTAQDVVISRVQAPNAAAAREPQHEPFTTPITLLRENRKVTNTATSSTLSERILDSRAFALQSNWLGDHLVSTVGWRREESSIRTVTAPFVSNGEGYVVVDDPTYSLGNPDLVPQVFEETLFAWSAVSKTPRKWLARLPGISALNLYYGTSENFSPPQARTVDAFGVEIPPPSGVTKEAGLYLEAFNGRVSARLNFFETTQAGDFNVSVGNIAANIIQIHSQVSGMVRAGNVPDRGDGFPENYVAPPQALLDTFNVQTQANGFITSTNPGVRDTSDFVTEGMELEVSFRPTRGLSFVFNAARQNSTRSNTGTAMRKLLFDTPTDSGDPIGVEWVKPWARFIPINAGALGKEGSEDINLVAGQFQRNILNTFNVAAAGDGAPAHELREWRANFVGNYQFQGERLKGFGIGTGVRWQDKAAIGFPVATFETDLTPSDGTDEISDIRIFDVRNPFFGPTEIRYDAWVSYQTKLFKGRIPMKIQLNVRNLLTNDELVPHTINPDGKVAVWSIAEGRRFTFSTRFSF